MDVLIVVALIVGLIYYEEMQTKKIKNNRANLIKKIDTIYNNKDSFEKKYSQLDSNKKIIDYYPIRINEIVGINPKEFVVFDCETTGLYANQGDKIIEFCFLKYKDGVLIDKLTALVNPNMQLSSKIENITGIKNDDLILKHSIDYYISDIIKFINNQIVIGHNVIFDIGFLESEISRSNVLKKDLHIRYIDTLEMAKKTIFDISNYKLETLKEYFNIKTKSHRAYADCETTYAVYNKCLELLNNKKK